METITFDLLNSNTWSFTKGMLRVQVEELLGEVPETFIKNKDFSEVLTDNFNKHGVHAYYNLEDQLIGLELFRSEGNSVEINGQNLLTLSFSEIEKLCEGIFELKSCDDGFETVDGNIRFYTSKNLLLSIYLVLS